MPGLRLYHRPNTQLQQNISPPPDHKYHLIHAGFLATRNSVPETRADPKRSFVHILKATIGRLGGIQGTTTQVRLFTVAVPIKLCQCSAKKIMFSCKLRGALELNQMCHDTEVISFIIHNYSLDQHHTASEHFILITKWFPGLFTHGVSENSGARFLFCLTSSRTLDIYSAGGRIKALTKAVAFSGRTWKFVSVLVNTWRWPPTGVTALLHVHKPFGLCSGPFMLTSRMCELCFMFLMVTEFILLGWMSRLAWVSPSQMPIRQLCLLITCPPLGPRASGSHTWLHPDYILPPARFIWLFMGRAALRWSHQKVSPLIEKGWAEVFQNLDLTPLTMVNFTWV